jgi:hypothetical protein
MLLWGIYFGMFDCLNGFCIVIPCTNFATLFLMVDRMELLRCDRYIKFYFSSNGLWMVFSEIGSEKAVVNVK